MARGLNALWWWIDRWRKSTAYVDLSLTEQGAYRNLLDEAVLRGGAIPDDENVLAKACGDPRLWRKVKPKVMLRFYRAADGWRNDTLDEVLAESRRRADKQRDYRNRHGNEVGNESGNEFGNRRDLSDPDTDSGIVNLHDRERGPGKTKPDTERVGRFVDRYRELHEQIVGVAYLGNPQKDYWAACELVAAFDDDMLEKITVFGLHDGDAFMTNGTRTITKLKSRASDYAQHLKAKRLA